MNCKTVQPLISAYLDHELSGSEMMIVREHIRCCEVCAQEEIELRELKYFMTELRIAEPDDAFAERILAMSFAQEPARRTVDFAARAGIAFAAAACVLAAGLFTYSRRATAPGARTMQASKNAELELARDRMMMHDGDWTSGVPIVSASYVGR